MGRVTLWLAGRFRRVVAFDVSKTHLEAARTRIEREGIRNVEFVLVRGKSNLARLAETDFFYSTIVLQHNPPPIIADILTVAFEGIRYGGTCFFQVPSYGLGYRFGLDDYWRTVAAREEMEIHFVPQRTVFDLARAWGVRPLEVQPDHMIGRWGRWISSTFLMRKD